MKIKLLIDEDVHAVLANAMRKRGYDAVNIQELNKKGLSDGELIIEAIKSERTILTFNVKDFVILHNKTVTEKRSHFGIIVSKQLSFSEILKKLLKLLQTTTDETMKDKLEFL